MVISEDAWDDIHKLIDKIHRPSSLGLFSFTNIIKQALVFKNVNIEGIRDRDIKIIGVVASEDYWSEANYPWELLALNNLKISDLVNDSSWIEEKEKTIFIRDANEWTEEKEREIGQNVILVSPDVTFSLSNGSRIKGPCVLGKNIEFHDYAIIEHAYIGDGCSIGNHAVIRDSTLVEGVKVNHDAVIENSIIMENSVVCYHAEVLHSIIGKEVMIGSDVKTPCQKLKKVDKKKTEYQKVTYFSDISIEKTDKFGAIVGDYCQIGSGTVIHPGRRVGKRSKIYANCEILKNVKPSSEIRNKDVTEGYN
jgi:NDP-sugar pyrophosphorylase family protein